MIISLRKWLERGQFVALFLVMTFVLHHLSVWISAWLEPTYRYKTPSLRSVKVFEDEGGWDSSSWTDRLRFYYWYGE